MFEHADPSERDAVAEWVRTTVHAQPPIRVDALAGDASVRRFYRIRDGLQRRWVVMVCPPSLAEQFHTMLAVYGVLRAIAWPVPRIHAVDSRRRWVVMDDGGDPAVTWVSDRIARDRLHSVRTAYQAWLSAWEELQQLRDRIPRLPAHHPIVQRDLGQRVDFEMEFFIRHFLIEWLGSTLTQRDVTRIRTHLVPVCQAFRTMPRYICHRDYHTRNILRRDSGFTIVDYQDMQFGPRAYDPVSLLRDCYIVLPDAVYTPLRERLRNHIPDDLEWTLVAVQRHLKALGTFGYQIVHRGRLFYRPAIRNTLHYLLTGELEAVPRLRQILTPLLEDARTRVE